MQRSAQVGQMLAFHNRDDTASRECIQRLLQHMSKHANLHLATVDVKNPGAHVSPGKDHLVPPRLNTCCVHRSGHAAAGLASHSNGACAGECWRCPRGVVQGPWPAHRRGPRAALKGVLARAKVREVPTVLALASGAILDVRSGPQSPVELARFVERFSQAVSG